jgi:hypothetical protein
VRTLLITFILLCLAAIVLFAFSNTPVITLPDSLSTLGQSSAVTIRIHDAHGIRAARAWVMQNGDRYPVWETTLPGHRIFWRRGVADTEWNFKAGARTVPQLKDGKAQLVVEATSNDFRGKTASVARELIVVTQPATISADQEQHYLYLGMADLVTLNPSGYWTEAGVRVGDQTFRAWPLPGGKPGFFSLFAFAWNMPPGTAPIVYAANPGGDQTTAPITFQFPKSEQPKYRVRDLPVDDHFVQKVVNELDPNGAGDLVTRFVKINSEMRRANNKTLAELRWKTEPRFLWSQPFLQQPNTKVEANFADVRNYIYKGQKIDQQVHLGYDLSSTQHVDVLASNDGKVLYAAPLGIYGNCIVIDHGYGLQSIYGHLSQIAVHEGDTVKRGQSMGKSGTTGMAGGDHIHFSMQLEGIQIDPKEWWDAHWIQDHIAKRVTLPVP